MQTVWVNTDTGSSPSQLKHHNGIVYFTSFGTGKLYAVDSETGHDLWEEESPNKSAYSQAGFDFVELTIDKEKELIYLNDRFFAMCIETIKR